MSTPTCVVIWLFAVIGFYELLFAAVSFFFLAPQDNSCGIIELRGHMENIEHLIRSNLLRSSGKLYIVDCGADEETLRIVCLFASSSSRIELLNCGDAVVMLGEDTVQ